LHHVKFDKLKPSNCFGARTLLDEDVFRRALVEEEENFKKRLGFDKIV